MKKKTIDNIVWLLFFLCLFIFFVPPLMFNPVLPIVAIIALFGGIWCFCRRNESIVNIIFLTLYLLFLFLLGMTG